MRSTISASLARTDIFVDHQVGRITWIANGHVERTRAPMGCATQGGCYLLRCPAKRVNFRLSGAVATQADHHVDTVDFVSFRGHRHLADYYFGMRNIEQVILVRYKKMMMLGHVGVEKGL